MLIDTQDEPESMKKLRESNPKQFAKLRKRKHEE